MPAVRIEPAANFFHIWDKQADAFPTWCGELYLERHQGTLTTQALIKRNNRRAEIALRELEWAATLADLLAGVAYPIAELDALWKEILLYQFHDILPGTSIERVYSECNARYEIMLAQISQLTEHRYRAIADLIACNEATIAFNSLSWPRLQWHKGASGNWHHLQVPAMGWSAVSACRKAVDFSQHIHAQNDCLENEHLRIRFAPEGYICSMLEKASGREYLQPGERGNDFVIITDAGDVWDFETDHPAKDVWPYLRRAIQRPTLVESHATTDGPLAQITQIWVYNNSQIRQRISLLAGAQQAEFDTEVDWREEGTMLRVRFASAITAEQATFEIPFGHISRSTLEQTPQEHAQIEVAAQQWVDLSQQDCGLALYNDCKYGFRVKGHVIDMALLRSVPYPGAPLINKGDNAQGATNNCTDLGLHHFCYALRPHSGPANAALLTQEARAFNTPLLFVETPAQVTNETTPKAIFTQTMSEAIPEQVTPAQTMLRQATHEATPAQKSWFVLDKPEIEIAAIKRAENGKGWILRLVNLCDQPIKAKLTTTLPLGTFTVVNLVEEPCASDTMPTTEADNPQNHVLNFAPFEIKTISYQ